jgi:hypothetical protein
VRGAGAPHAERSRSQGIRRPGRAGVAEGSEEVAEIGKLLLTLSRRSLTPPKRTPLGYRLRLAPDAETEAALDEFVHRDRECCPFLDFSAQREPDALQLVVRGPQAASRLLDLCVEVASLGTTHD